MDDKKKKILNNYIYKGYIGLPFLLLSDVLDRGDYPGGGFCFIVGICFIFYGIGMSSIYYHKWK